LHSGANDTAANFDLIFARFWLPLKGISIEKTYIGQLTYTIPITLTQKIWGLTKVDDFLGEYEVILEKVLTRESGA
jgi:hypothetical protein